MKPAPNPTKRQLAALAPLVDGQWTDDALDRLSRDLSSESRKVTVESEAETIVRLSAELDQVHSLNQQIYKSYAAKSYQFGVLTEKNEQLTEKNAALERELIDAEAENTRVANDRAWAGLVCFIAACVLFAWWWGSR